MIQLSLSIVAMLSVACWAQGGESSATPRPIVGAIRWDAWCGGPVTRQVERTLGPARYHYRLPWFGRVIDDKSVSIDGSSQAIMDREIAYAADAGINYWAFVQYDHDNPLSVALHNYLRSDQRHRIKFCLILHNPFGVTEERWPVQRDRALALLKDKNYQAVLDGRPLVYSFQMDHKGEFAAQRFEEFRQMARDAGLNPYYVYMGWSPKADFDLASKHGYDAVSSYGAASKVATFAELCRYIETDLWSSAASAGVPYIPMVSTGWDPSPRNDNPVSWSNAIDDRCVPTATPREIAGHLRRALQFVRDNPRTCPANAVIVYAWNEHDEGGWLSPTWTPDGEPDTQRLEALAALLRR
jgi:hypothetical protein